MARTNVPFRQVVFVGAFLSLATPVIVKGIGWILLLGPNNGLINNLLREWFGIDGTPIELFSLGGMIFVEGLLFTPIAFLLTLPALSAMDPALEEAAAMAGARWPRTLLKVTLPLARPSILAVLLLALIRALESFEVPLLIGIPGGVQTVTTALYQTVHSGFIPRYGEASAYAVLLVIAVALPLSWYYRATREAAKFATVTGKGFRPARIDLGPWKYPCALWVLIIPVSLAAPLLIMLWASFLPLYSGPSPDDFARMTLANYRAVWTRDDILAGIINSLLVGTGSACAVAAAGLMMGWIVARRRELMRWAIDVVASLPLVFPGIVLGIAILVQFLDLRFIPIYGTVWILIFAFVVQFLPYGMRFCHSGVLSINRDLEDGAYMSGARLFHRAAPDRVAACFAGRRRHLDLCLHACDPGFVGRNPSLGARQRHRLDRHPRSVEQWRGAAARRTQRPRRRGRCGSRNRIHEIDRGASPLWLSKAAEFCCGRARTATAPDLPAR